MRETTLLLITLALIAILAATVAAGVPDRAELPADCQKTLGQFIAHEYPPAPSGC